MDTDGTADVGADLTYPERGWTDKLQQAEARNARLLGANTVIGLVCAGLAAAVLYLAAFRAPPGYVLRVDANGDVTWGGWIGAEPLEGDEYVPGQLMRFVERWRTVTPDNTMQKREIRRLYCMVDSGTPAYARLNEYFRETSNDPFRRNESESVQTVIRSVEKLGGSTWQIEWYEDARAHDGRPLGERLKLRATLIVQNRAVRPDCLEGNPLGVEVSELTWGTVR